VRRCSIVFMAFFLARAFAPFIALAGPPFLTDDPEPVEYRHWEMYIATLSQGEHGGVAMTAPHFEVNYGIVPDLQIHLIAPLEYVKIAGRSSHYGYGDTELGTKWRFYNDEEKKFMIGVYPLLEVPTGDESKGLGNGQPQVFLPLWLQKAWGPWLTYGGGGYWFNPGTGHKDFYFVGWELQRDINKYLTLGSEFFYQAPRETDDERHFGFNIGSIINITENHHILLSAGTDIIGPTDFYSYFAYQFTFGPGKEPENTKPESKAGNSMWSFRDIRREL